MITSACIYPPNFQTANSRSSVWILVLHGTLLTSNATELNSEAAKKTTFTLPPGPKTLQFKNSYFCFLLSIQGGVGQLFGDFVVTGYGDGGSNRYHVAKLQYGSNVNIAIGDEGTRSITLTNTSTNAAQCVMLDLIWLNIEASSHLIASGSENSFCAAFQSRYQYYTNVNYMLASGIYKTGKTGLNLPFEGYWIIITFNTSNDLGNSSTAWITQFAISTDLSDKAIYFRRNINYTPTTWESWNRLVAS